MGVSGDKLKNYGRKKKTDRKANITASLTVMVTSLTTEKDIIEITAMKAGDMVVVRIIITVREMNARIVLRIIRVLVIMRTARSVAMETVRSIVHMATAMKREENSVLIVRASIMEDRMKEGSVLNVLRIILALIIMKEMNSVLSVLALIMDSRGKVASANNVLAIIMEVREGITAYKEVVSVNVLPIIIRMRSIA